MKSDEPEPIEARIRHILCHRRHGGSPGVPLSEIPFRYDRVLREMELAGEVLIWWTMDPANGRWLHYVRLKEPVQPVQPAAPTTPTTPARRPL